MNARKWQHRWKRRLCKPVLVPAWLWWVWFAATLAPIPIALAGMLR